MQTIVDYGWSMVVVFVYHKVYGILKAPMNIHSRLDIEAFVEELEDWKIQSFEKYHIRLSLSYRVSEK